MESSMNSFISNQLHVAQQSRREKLRVQHCSPSRSAGQYHVRDYASSLDIVQPVFNLDLAQTGDDMRNSAGLLNHPASGPSEVTNFPSTLFSNSRNNAMEDQFSNPVNSIKLVTSNVDSSLKPRIENSLENCSGVWKSVSANSNSDNWNTDCIGRYRKSNSQGIVSDIPAFEMRAKQNTNVHHQSQFQQGDLNFETQLHYQNAHSDGVTTAVIGLQPNERGGPCASWESYGGDAEHVRLAPYGYQSDICWNAEMSLLNSRANQVVVDSHSQRLSLSLCSNPAGSIITGSQFGNFGIPHSIPLHNVASIAFQDSKPCSPYIRSIGVGQGNPLKESVGPSTSHHRQTGPLGPFTGYATILKSSRFLRPAQHLLNEYCGVIGKHASSSTRAASGSDIGEFGDLATAVNSIVSDAVTTNDIMGVSAATQQDSDEIVKGDGYIYRESLRPDYQDKKAKLLYMLEEVSRRYKQYYQQMQMVVSAFESVAGLAGATPYISSALKSVSGHFNHLKSAISDQLRHIKTFFGEDFSLPRSGIRDKRDFNSKRLKYTDHIFQKHKSGGSSIGLLEPQQHIWRPQRGLPERAVSVLRAWLFEHFLHPYPTDTDKHMLATQTGLTRSQVSNWFINARVRLWKPMVEEVHMLETNGVAERNKNAAEVNNVSTNADLVLNKMVGSSMASVNLECPATGSSYGMADVPSIDEGMLDISRYHQTGHELSKLGSISLTLGLKQSADQFNGLESSYQHPPYLRQQDHLRQHHGGHTTHEYAG